MDYTGALTFQVTESWTNADGSTGSDTIRDNVEVYAPGSPIFAWSGDDVLTGSSGNDLFVFSQPIGHDIDLQFRCRADQIDLIGYAGFTSFADVQAHLANDAHGNAVITLGDGQSITMTRRRCGRAYRRRLRVRSDAGHRERRRHDDHRWRHAAVGGMINNTGTIALNSTARTDLQLIEHGITLQGGGQLILSDSSETWSSEPTRCHADQRGQHHLRRGTARRGQMTLVNEGTIDATGTNALVIDTGSNVITNAGTIEATGAGGLIINSAVDNSGSLWANGGNLTINGAVTGDGSATISGATTLEFGAASAVNTGFAADATGTLKLDQSSGFTGTISGFGADDALDLADIAFDSNTTLGYSANADGTGGMLTVSDGTHNASIALLGQYVAAGFQVGSDQGTGTMVTYTPPAASDPTSITNPNQTT